MEDKDRTSTKCQIHTHTHTHTGIHTEWGKSRFTVLSTKNTEFIIVLLFINYCVIFHMNNCKLLWPNPV